MKSLGRRRKASLKIFSDAETVRIRCPCAAKTLTRVRSDIQMRELSRLTKENYSPGALDEDSIVYIHKIDSMYNLAHVLASGVAICYTARLSAVLLAWRDREEVKQILDGVSTNAVLQRTITSTTNC